jgi:hypothetical protein
MSVVKWFTVGMQLAAIGVALFLAYWPMAYISLDDDYWAPLISLHPILCILVIFIAAYYLDPAPV